jgi:3-oxoisoapionate decarboxylase
MRNSHADRSLLDPASISFGMTRRNVLALAGAAPIALMPQTPRSPVKLGIDLFSLRSENWSPIQFLDYCAQRGAKVVHFSEIRFIGSLEPDNLQKVREHAGKLGIEIEIGMRSICPTSKMFDPKQGTAEEQLNRMLDAAHIVGSHIVRAVLGSMEDRRPGPIERHIESTVRVLHNVRSKAQDLQLKIAIENHAGDMQARELKMLIEEAGAEFVGACLDSGNPLWTIEDPHLTLETLHPYVLTSHLRDSAVWQVPEGAAVSWVRMGEGNVGIDDYVRKYESLCPGRALSLESIILGPRIFPYRDPAFWDAYRTTPAWQFQRFVAISEHGKAVPAEPWEKADEARRQREALDASLAHLKKVLNA